MGGEPFETLVLEHLNRIAGHMGATNARLDGFDARLQESSDDRAALRGEVHELKILMQALLGLPGRVEVLEKWKGETERRAAGAEGFAGGIRWGMMLGAGGAGGLLVKLLEALPIKFLN